MSGDLYTTVIRPQNGQGQTVAYTGTAGVITNPLPQGCQSVIVMCTTLAHVRVGIDPTATTADLAVPALTLVRIAVDQPSRPGSGGQIKVSAVQAASGGNLHVMPLPD